MRCPKCGNSQLFIKSSDVSDFEGEEYIFIVIQTKDKQGYFDSVKRIDSLIIGNVNMFDDRDDLTLLCARCGVQGGFDNNEEFEIWG